jgi:phosphatidylserine decarboxylase
VIINENNIIAPADGKVVVIEEVTENEYFKDKRIQLSIFMSPINVHINRYPISGIVKYSKYHPGLFLVAWHPKSSTDNERTTIVVEHKNGREVLFRQIAGAMARRIVNYSKEGDTALQGDEFGFIKFGSRVDILLPLDIKINVSLEQPVKGRQTVIATFE